ncbi:MAG TPA: PIN domain-containing protein [Vicinamibacterales bacterium]|jgi:predicted nucleic acid-binding protein|nr:PIN domain-containing protein [Vicinamibacterales bacterium]
MRVVLDSSVLVAGFRSRRGASFRALTLLRSGKFDIAVSVPLVLEDEAVLRRHADKLGLGAEEVVGLVDYLCGIGHQQAIHFLWRPALRDPKDEFVLELAVAAECSAIVTHNVRDFEGAKIFGIEILTPAEFIFQVEAIR